MIRTLTVLAASFSALLFATLASANSISISTDVLNSGNAGYGQLADGTSSPTAQVNYVHFVTTNSGITNPASVQYDNAGSTVNLTGEIALNTPERGPGQNLQINGYANPGSTSPPNTNNLFITGEPDANNPGFGAHANWVVTLNLDAIRAADFAGSSAPLYLTGTFGAWGAIGVKTGGNIQGEILLDGTRADGMGHTSVTPPVNQSFTNLVVPGSAHELSFLILNGNTTSSLWDDGVFQNVTLSTTPEPSSLILCGLGLVGLVVAARRRK